jgi:hypothetical protein
MRLAAKTDRNHAEIVRALRRCGCSVQSLAAVGGGVPDLLVGFCGRNYLLEIKDGKAPPSQRRLTSEQTRWHESWRGKVHVVTSVEEAIRAVAGTA